MADYTTEGINEEFIKSGASKIRDEDFKKVNDQAEDIKNKFESGGPLGRFIEDVMLLIAIVKDYYNGTYRSIPYWAIGAIVFALLYVLNPIDLIPDAIPVIGLVDDALVVGICLKMVEQELHKYKEWKINDSNVTA